MTGLGVGTAGGPGDKLGPAPSREQMQKPDGGTRGHGEPCQAVLLALRGASPPVHPTSWCPWAAAVGQGVLACLWSGFFCLAEPVGTGGILDQPALLSESESGG